jgi:hypothetical protein
MFFLMKKSKMGVRARLRWKCPNSSLDHELAVVDICTDTNRPV